MKKLQALHKLAESFVPDNNSITLYHVVMEAKYHVVPMNFWYYSCTMQAENDINL